MSKKKHNFQKQENSQIESIEEVYDSVQEYDYLDDQIDLTNDITEEEILTEQNQFNTELNKQDNYINENNNIQNFPKPLLHALRGEPIKLNHTPVYRMAIDQYPSMHLSGTFYFYDSTVVNGRGKITTYKNIKKPNPCLILGYIDF